MQEWILEAVGQFGYLGVFLMIAAENIFPPIPSELILTFGGFFAVQAGLFLPGMIAAATAGSLAGALALYFIGRFFGRERMRALVEKHGGLLSLGPADLDRTYDRFAKWQGKAVFFCRLFPLLRSLISIPAGMSGMRLPGFLALTAAGSLIWNTALMCAGAALGSRWGEILAFMKTYSAAAYLAVGVGLAIVAVRLIRKKQGAPRD